MIIGIDLGTTNSVACYRKDGQNIVIRNAEGNNTTPSVVYLGKKGSSLVGKKARERRADSPTQTIWSVKRLMGLKFHDLKDEDRDLPYKIERFGKDDLVIATENGKYTPEQVSAEVLSKIKRDCEKALGCNVERAVITVPAYFSDNQREATRRAGELAGLEVVSILSEPTAAALAYSVDGNTNQTIAVYDLGGGTFDISILRFENGTCRVLSTNGDVHLGGDDIDRRIQNHFVSAAATKSGRDIREEMKDPVRRANATNYMQLFRILAEKAKIRVCENPLEKAEVKVENFSHDGDITLELSPKKMEQISSIVTDYTMKCCQNALDDAGLSIKDIDRVILVGGSTKSPFVRKAVEDFFGQKPDTSVNPDEAVALGAAVKGGILEGTLKSIRLADVTPLTLGIMARGNVAVPLIKRNTTIPCSKSVVFTNATETETLSFPICQGESKSADKNTRVGILCVPEITEKAGQARIRITFSIDENGIVQVSARNENRGTEQTIKLHRKAV